MVAMVQHCVARNKQNPLLLRMQIRFANLSGCASESTRTGRCTPVSRSPSTHERLSRGSRGSDGVIPVLSYVWWLDKIRYVSEVVRHCATDDGRRRRLFGSASEAVFNAAASKHHPRKGGEASQFSQLLGSCVLRKAPSSSVEASPLWEQRILPLQNSTVCMFFNVNCPAADRWGVQKKLSA